MVKVRERRRSNPLQQGGIHGDATAKCIHYFLPASALWLIREASAAFIIQECFLWSLLKIRWDLKDRRRCRAGGRLLSFSCFVFFLWFLYVFDTRRSPHLTAAAAAAAADLRLCDQGFTLQTGGRGRNLMALKENVDC